jgi:hypothetical protein
VRTYWDTSAAINALISPEVWARLDPGEHFARLHLFSEFFATLTGRGIPAKNSLGQPVRLVLTSQDAAIWLKGFRAKVTLIELDDVEILQALARAHTHSVQGGRVYDYVHALAAEKARAHVVLTRNKEDFGLTEIAIEWP